MASPNRDLADISYRENIEYLDRLNSISERTMPASCDASPLEEKKITY